jgi:hypothetical protein
LELRSDKRNEFIIGEGICQDFAGARQVAAVAEAIAESSDKGEILAAPSPGLPVDGAAKHARQCSVLPVICRR